MTFLKLLRSIPTDGEITPELERKLRKAANALLNGEEGGHCDLPEIDHFWVGYGEYDGLRDLSEPEIIEQESTFDRSDEVLVQAASDETCHHVLIVYDGRGREMIISAGAMEDLVHIRRRLELIRVRKGFQAYQEEVKKLREKYLWSHHEQN